jgi:inorganic pyrophosphatase
MTALDKLDPFVDGKTVQMIVETPRGAGVKLEYDPDRKLFTVSRALPLGLTYPFDWGFIPGTLSEDGDPVDALALHDAATFPGVLLPCRVLGVVDVEQNSKKGGREFNPRLILMPTWHDRLGEFERAKQLPDRLKAEIEQFFLSATFFTGKKARITGWRGPKAADKIIRKAMVARRQ